MKIRILESIWVKDLRLYNYVENNKIRDLVLQLLYSEDKSGLGRCISHYKRHL